MLSLDGLFDSFFLVLNTSCKLVVIININVPQAIARNCKVR